MTIQEILRVGYGPDVCRIRMAPDRYREVCDILLTVPSRLYPMKYLGLPIEEDELIPLGMIIFDKGRGR